MVLYGDKSTPVNALRPDVGRSFEAFYWCCEEYPEWFRRRSENLFTFCHIASADMKALGCPRSSMHRWVLERMFLDTELSTLGMFVDLGGEPSLG